MKRILTLLFTFIVCLCINAQVINFLAVSSNKGNVDQHLNIYGWTHWEQDKTSIVFDLPNNVIKIGENVSYEIIERPTKCVIKRDHRYYVFGCIDKGYNKVCVKLYVMDDCKRFYIYVNEHTQSIKYAAKLIE